MPEGLPPQAGYSESLSPARHTDPEILMEKHVFM